jgi:hypothetical protein
MNVRMGEAQRVIAAPLHRALMARRVVKRAIRSSPDQLVPQTNYAVYAVCCVSTSI